jgi:hypothetical protein
MTAAREARGPASLELIEESVHLLRRASAGTLAIYFAGTVPFVLGFMFFWARTTWFRPSDAALAWAAFGLVGLFAGMKAAHAEFCARLMALRVGDVAPTWTVGRFARVLAAQLRIQAWGIIAIPLSLLLTVPFGWTYAYFQSAGVIGDDDRLSRQAAQQAQLWPAQNHLGLLFLSVFAGAVWVNTIVACWMVPWLANRLLGIESIFGFSGWWFFNTSFVASTVALTWLAVDPLVKAFYTLRVFYGRARRSGEDIRVELRTGRANRRSRAVRVTAVVTLLVASMGMPDTASAETVARSESERIEAAALNRAIDEVLARGEFEWRLRPMPRAENTELQEESWAWQVMRSGSEWVRDTAKSIFNAWKRLRRWMADLFPDAPSTSTGAGSAFGWAAMQVVLWLLIVAVVALILSVVVLAWRRSRNARKPVIAAQGVQRASPDLRDEATQAGQLPTEGWLELAREQLARGEWRLALRALYLATLARLAVEGFVTLAKFKTNLDYERELRRRALMQQDIVAWFAAHRLAFEQVWYGRAAAGEAAVREWLTELERRTAT